MRKQLSATATQYKWRVFTEGRQEGRKEGRKKEGRKRHEAWVFDSATCLSNWLRLL